jgi:hypothetical protein
MNKFLHSFAHSALNGDISTASLVVEQMAYQGYFSRKEGMSVYIYVYIFIYIYMYICMYRCIFIYK